MGLFSIIFQILGLDVDMDEYEGFSYEWVYFIFTYRNTMGDLTTPGYGYWTY